MQEEVNQPGPSLPTSGLRAGGGGQAGQNSWTRIGQQRFPGCDLAKERSLGILWPFLGTLSWSLAQVLGKDERVGAGEGSREELCPCVRIQGSWICHGMQEVLWPVSEPLQI